MNCPQCSKEITDLTTKFCPQCGFHIVNTTLGCPQCSKEITDPATKFCPECGYLLKKESSANSMTNDIASISEQGPAIDLTSKTGVQWLYVILGIVLILIATTALILSIALPANLYSDEYGGDGVIIMFSVIAAISFISGICMLVIALGSRKKP